MSTSKTGSYIPPSSVVTEDELSTTSSAASNTKPRTQTTTGGSGRHARTTGTSDGSAPVIDVYKTQTEMMSCLNLNTRSPVVLTYCPCCENKGVKTRTETKPNGVTWACVGAGALIFWPLCWVPLVMDETKITRHYCQTCGAKVGKVKPLR